MDPRLSVIPAFVFHGIILSWVNKLENKCECSADWRRDYIKYFSILSILLVIGTTFMRQNPALGAIAMAWFIAGLMNIGSILTYVPYLKKKQCDCAIKGDWRDDFIFWWVLIAFIFAFAGSVIILARK